VAEVLCEAGIPNLRFLRLGLPSQFNKAVGEQEYLRTLYGLDPPGVAARVADFCRGRSSAPLRKAA
jgi:transketolase C-terminal domain/subunit